MKVIRERILIGMKNYSDFSEHKDLISFCVNSECFEDWEEVENNNNESLADFNELVVIVEKNWLFKQIQKMGINNPRKYLQEEYTSDDSYEWFLEAKDANKIVMVGFN